MKRKANRSFRAASDPLADEAAPKRRRPGAAAARKAKSREHVVAVAMNLFLLQGFDRTTVREIVTEAGISMRTFFRYFPSKEGLAFPRADEGTARLRAALAEHRDPRHPLIGVREGLVELGLWYEETKTALLKEWQYESRSATLLARGAEIARRNEMAIAEALEDAGVPADAAHYLASVVFGAIRANLEQWFAGDCRQDLLELSANSVLLLEGLDALFFDEGRFRMPSSVGERLAAPSTTLKGLVARVSDRLLGKPM